MKSAKKVVILVKFVHFIQLGRKNKFDYFFCMAFPLGLNYLKHSEQNENRFHNPDGLVVKTGCRMISKFIPNGKESHSC